MLCVCVSPRYHDWYDKELGNLPTGSHGSTCLLFWLALGREGNVHTLRVLPPFAKLMSPKSPSPYQSGIYKVLQTFATFCYLVPQNASEWMSYISISLLSSNLCYLCCFTSSWAVKNVLGAAVREVLNCPKGTPPYNSHWAIT